MPIKSFADQSTADLAAGLNTKHARRVPQRVWKAAQTKLDALHAATKLSDLARPGWKLHELGRELPGVFSLYVNDQYRLVFRFTNGDAYDVRITDYHP